MNIITGYRGEPHVTAQQVRYRNIATFGWSPRVIYGINSELDATVVSANEVSIASGMVSCQGCTAEIPLGTSESVSIDNGSQGMLRKDLIVVRYTKNASTGVESMSLVVIKGTPASSNPQTPSYTTGSISAGDTLVDFPLYRVNINGISIDSVDLLMDKVSVPHWVTTLTESINALRTRATNLETKIGTTAMGTTATTITAAIKELLGIIGTATMSTSATTVKGAVNGLINGLNSLRTRATNLDTKVGSVTMGTTATTVTGAVKELMGIIGTATMSTSATTVKGAINELLNKINSANSSITTLNTHDSNQSIVCVSVAFGNLTFDSTGAINSIKNVSESIPSGYSMIAAIPFASGSYAAYFYSCGMESANTVRIKLFRGEWTSVTQTNPSVVLICKKNL